MDIETLEPFHLQVISPGQKEKVFFRYGGVPNKYDTELQLRVLYARNDAQQDCVENYLLSGELYGQDKLDFVRCAVDIFVQSLEEEDFLEPATGIRMKTVNGKLEFQVFPDDEVYYPPFPLPPIPPLLEYVKRVNITELVRLDRICASVDLVTWEEDDFAFKKMPDDNPEFHYHEILTIHLLRQVPGIVRLEALVINSENRIRGFLTKYMKQGDLDHYLRRPKLTKRKKLHEDFVHIPWDRKLSWCLQVTQAVSQMHHLGVINGDLKPANVLVTDDDELQIIDFCRVGPTMSWGAPEYVNAWEDYLRSRDKAMRESEVPIEVPTFDFDTHLTPAVDAYGLGGILWSIGEEHSDRLDERVWKNTPKWFSTLVDRCLSDRPEHRPSVGRILYMLEHKGREIEEPEIVETPIPNTP